MEVTELVELVETIEFVLPELDVTEALVLVRVTEGADEVVVLEAVEDILAGVSAENAAYDARMMTTATATAVTLVFLAIAVLKMQIAAIRQL